ncbi:MAG: radical SAM protein [Clostridiales bacterium]|nr:radical SAM protein [Clostridiales bacterium]
MTQSPEKVFVPPWISCRTYLFGQEESRTYIANEKMHTYVLLEGLASDMWKLLLDNTSRDELTSWAENCGVSDQVEDFLADLEKQGLICRGQANDVAKAAYEPFSSDEHSDEEKKFIEEMQAWLFEKKFLFSTFFELTYNCNLKCVHCYNPKNTAALEIDFDLCKKAIDDAYDLGCFRITFSGGEATLHTRFSELVGYARNKRMSVEIFTNGQTLAKNGKLYGDLLKLYPYRICVSLYSTDKEMHERVTDVGGSFENTYSLIHRLRKDNVNVQIKNFLLNFNCMDCIKVKNMARDICATSVADISLIPTIEGDKKTMRYVLDEGELFELYTNPESPLYIGTDFIPLDYDKVKDEAPCLGGFNVLCVNPDGKVVICVSMPYSVGDLNTSTLKDIWQDAVNAQADSRLYQWQRVRISDCTECYKQDYCAFCNYCPGMGYLENGYLKRSEVLCAQAKVKMRAYHYLKGKD